MPDHTPNIRAGDPPHAVDAERAVLGAMLLDNALIDRFGDTLPAEDLYNAHHRLVYPVMRDLFNKKGYVDALTLGQTLKEQKKLADAGGAEYIADLASTSAAEVNMEAYIDIITQTAALRETIRTLTESVSAAFSPGDKSAQQVLEDAESNLFAVGDRFRRTWRKTEKIKITAPDYFAKISELAAANNLASLKGAPTGYATLDNFTAGLHKGDLIILAGRPGTGKTAFALNLLRHITAAPAAGQKTGAIFFSMEMSAEQLTARLLSHAGINLHNLAVRNSNVTSNELKNLSQATSEMEEREIYIDDSAMLKVNDARARVRRIKREMEKNNTHLGLIIVDYLQLMEGDRQINERHNEVATISRGLKALAKDMQVPVLALSQLNRNVETNPDLEPQLSHLRESGAIEQDADLIMFLHRGKKSDKDDKSRLEIKLIIGKHRNGPVGFLNLHFNAPFSRFIEAAPTDGSGYTPVAPPASAADDAPDDF